MSRCERRSSQALGRILLSSLTDRMGQTWMEEDGEDRWVQPWSPTWQHLMPYLLCQCDRRHTHSGRDQQRDAGNCGRWGL
ncbi:hypothetical protein GBF38_011452 [Nibea albiflora]|uniref:Uncharacterized protein n=1 Tax=Nibea albiflora TaxID=240163 RepID=A0ACB7F3R8_NIBAL|nr:hypothetical protein GBF38_011452 [Nibea albiflora]